jgi:hypothetical protein
LSSLFKGLSMAISSSANLGSVTSAAFSQLRVQQAQQNAQRAEAEARALVASARAAQSNADRAQEGARSLKVQADQAQGDASQARQGVDALQSAARSRTELGSRLGQVIESQSRRDSASGPEVVPEAPASAVPATPAPAPAPAATPVLAAAVSRPVVNSSGQTTGTTISVQA